MAPDVSAFEEATTPEDLATLIKGLADEEIGQAVSAELRAVHGRGDERDPGLHDGEGADQRRRDVRQRMESFFRD